MTTTTTPTTIFLGCDSIEINLVDYLYDYNQRGLVMLDQYKTFYVSFDI